MLMLIAWPVGGNFPFVRTVVGICAAVSLLLALVSQFRLRSPQKLTISWLFLALGLGWAIFQIMPASEILSASQFNSISFYPAASKERLAELAFLVSILIATSCLVTTRRAVWSVMMTAAVSGMALAFVGIVQKLIWNGKLLWVYEYTKGGSPFASFVNKNNAGGFLVACLTGAMFFIAYQYFKWKPKSQQIGGLQLDWKDSREKSTLLTGFLEFFAAIQPRHLYSFAALIFICVGISMSLSRGAMLGMCASCAVAMILMPMFNRYMAVLLSIFAMAGGGLMVWLEQSSRIIARVETMGDLELAGRPRLQHWQDVMPYITEHALWGSGLGTYRYLHLPFESRQFEATFAYAENMYLETLAELGSIGLIALVGFLFTCLVLCRRLMNRQHTLDRALGVAGICCIAGQATSAIFDFGLYLPATSVVVAILLGTVIARASSTAESGNRFVGHGDAPRNTVVPSVVRGVLLAGLLALCLLGLRESYAVESLRHAQLLLRDYSRSLGEKPDLLPIVLARLETAKLIRPDDAEVDFQMGEYNVAKFRHENTELTLRLASEATNANVSEQTGDSPKVTNDKNESIENSGSGEPGSSSEGSAPVNPLDGFSRADVWVNTSLTSIHRILRFAERNNPELLEQLDSNPNLVYLKTAWNCYLDSESKCDYLPKSQFRLAQLSALFDEGNENQHLELALTRSSPSSELLFEAGLLAVHSRDQTKATELWHECLTRTRKFETEIVQSSMSELPMNTLFEKVLLQNPEDLIRISQKYLYQGNPTLPNDRLLNHTRRVLKQADIAEQRRLFLGGEIERYLENFKGATQFYRAALDLDDNDIKCRLNYAICLQNIDDYEEAVKQLKICELTHGNHLPAVRGILKKIRNQRKKQF